MSWPQSADFSSHQHFAAAAREAAEEAGAEVSVKHLISVYSVPHISQVHMWYRAELQLPETPEAARAVASDTPFILHAPKQQTAEQEDATKRAYGFAPAHESSAVGLFPFSALPWGEFAFPSAEGALLHTTSTRSMTGCRLTPRAPIVQMPFDFTCACWTRGGPPRSTP